MRPVRRKSAPPEVAGSTWTCTAPAADGSSWTREAQQQRGSSWTRTAAILRGSSWTREAKLQDGSSWTREAKLQDGSSWTREAKQQDGSSWTRQAQQQTGSSWTRLLPKAVVAGFAAIAMGAAGSPAFASTTAEPASEAPQPGGTYLIRTDAAHLAAVSGAVKALGGTVLRTMAAVGILEVSLPAGTIGSLSHAAGVLGATPDGAVKLATDAYDPAADSHSLASTTAAVGLRGASGYRSTGAGVDVAIVDSGVAPVAGLDGANKVIHGPDLSFESQNPNTRYLDTFGHGTHLAGIIAGHDAGTDPAFLGVAPDSRILSVKVADSHGNSDVSQVIAGIDWVVEHAQDKRAGLNVRVLNLSFGTDSNASYLKDPLSQAVEVAWQRGIVVVVSAGNRGSELGHLTDPAIDPFVVAVAAGDDEGGVAAFSSIGDGTRNPDVTAPGSHIPSLRVPGSFVDSMFGATASVGTRFIRGSGTSQAAAFVSGMVADMLQANPAMTPDEAKYRLRSTATPLNALPNAAGAGLVNADALNTSASAPVVDAPAATSDTATAGISTDPTKANRAKRTDYQAWSSVSDAATQRFTPSTGDGPLQNSRGSYVLVNGQRALTGDKDIFSKTWNGAALAKKRANSNIWKGGVYNGSAWGGSAWGGSAWGGSAWGGSAWGGSAWGGSAWGGSAWGNGTWSGSAWGGSAWGGSAWGGSAWGGSAWGGSAWGGSAWGGSAWGGSAWGSVLWG